MSNKVKTNFYSCIYQAHGKLLETEIYFNNSIDNVIKQLEQYKIKYPEYDWLQLENNADNGYCLTGYIKEEK